MKRSTPYSNSNWDFSSIWNILYDADHISYPFLRAFTYDTPDANPEVNPIPGLAHCTDPTGAPNIGSDIAICYNTKPNTIVIVTQPTGYIGILDYKWQSSTDGTTFSDISGANSSSLSFSSNLTQTTWYKRLAKDGTCNTTFAPSYGVWKVTVYPQFTVGEINSTGETICYNGNPAEIGSKTDASGGDGSISYQ